jgi:hypothetical protein
VFAGNASTNNWQAVAPAGAGFSVLMPGAPVPSTKEVTSDAGPTVSRRFVYAVGDEAYIVTYNDYKSALDVEKTLAGVRDAQVGQGHLLWETPTSQDGWAGKKIAAIVDNHLMISEFYASGTRLYQVIYVTSKAIVAPLSAPAFLGSFRIVQ